MVNACPHALLIRPSAGNHLVWRGRRHKFPEVKYNVSTESMVSTGECADCAILKSSLVFQFLKQNWICLTQALGRCTYRSECEDSVVIPIVLLVCFLWSIQRGPFSPEVFVCLPFTLSLFVRGMYQTCIYWWPRRTWSCLHSCTANPTSLSVLLLHPSEQSFSGCSLHW